jgi:hypothetical protein
VPLGWLRAQCRGERSPTVDPPKDQAAILFFGRAFKSWSGLELTVTSDVSLAVTCFVLCHLLSSARLRRVTAMRPPAQSVSARTRDV